MSQFFDCSRQTFVHLDLLQAVQKKHVNLVDLVEGSKTEVRIFKTEQELSEYTRETGKFFPKEDAADGGILRALRRHILVPRQDRIENIMVRAIAAGRRMVRSKGV
jgi:hypothetical protein